MFVSLPTRHRKSLIFHWTIPILKHLSRQPQNPLLIAIDRLQAVMSNQISSSEKLGVEAAKLDKVHGVNKEHETLFTSQKTLSKHFYDHKGPRRSHSWSCSQQVSSCPLVKWKVLFFRKYLVDWWLVIPRKFEIASALFLKTLEISVFLSNHFACSNGKEQNF